MVRPALERLRDLVCQVPVDVLLVYSPDRLARKYAYQALLVNRRIGIVDTSVTPPAPPSPLNAPDNPRLPECRPDAKALRLDRLVAF